MRELWYWLTRPVWSWHRLQTRRWLDQNVDGWVSVYLSPDELRTELKQVRALTGLRGRMAVAVTERRVMEAKWERGIT